MYYIITLLFIINYLVSPLFYFGIIIIVIIVIQVLELLFNYLCSNGDVVQIVWLLVHY